MNKLFAAAAAIFLLIVGIPRANAADIPVLTWEKGKEHNIVLGGNGIERNWNIELRNDQGTRLKFKKSREDARGFVVYSINLPDGFASGIYTVQTDRSREQSRTVAGVRVIDISNYNLIQIPIKLFILLFMLIILMSTLSILRMEKYEKIEYIRAKPASPPEGFLGILYRFREGSIEEIHQSVFKFQLIRQGELLHKFSPMVWALLPWMGLITGMLVSLNVSRVDGVQLTPVLVYMGVALLGLLDPFTGFMAGFGFALLHCVTGNVVSVRALMSLVAVSIGWFAPGIIASFFSDALNKDRYSYDLKRFFPDVLSSLLGGLIFYSALLLTNSFADHQGPITAGSYIPALLFSIINFVRIQGEKFLNRDLHQTGQNYQIRSLVLPRVVSPRTVLFGYIYFAAAIYIWTESKVFALEVALIFVFPMMLLMVRFENPKVRLFKKYDRHIFLEVSVLLLLAYSVFNFIQSLPLEITQKGRMFLGYTAVLLSIHAIYSSIYDSSHRESEQQEMELAA